ncbi:lantibiotic dehydratase [Trinickia diaoshuihuensis]|uniref:lantibiotic dehydratase n=1 Tax=Trinickia diaoshuihuensis TaxID=2292265 RepID=UPI000E265AD3|nr:lantibiotic dehydratase [Trinickia diaoshuihuensis]
MSLSSFFWMRSAGFPISWLERFAVRLDEQELARFHALTESIEARIERIRQGLLKAGSPVALKVVRKLTEGMPLTAKDWPADQTALAADELEPLHAERAELAQLSAALEASFGAAATHARAALFETLRDPLLREAVFLSNPSALERVETLAECAPERVDNRMRQRLRLAWSYVQRLCAKNDTTSFFGPIAWGEFGSADAHGEASSFQVEFGEGGWIGERRTYFEHWVISRVATAMSEDPVLGDTLPISLSPACALVQGALQAPGNRRIAVHGALLAVLEELEAQRAHGIKRALLRERCLARGFDGTSVDAAIDSVLAKGIAARAVRIPTGLADPLGALRAYLAHLDPGHPRTRFWRELFESLERERRRFATGGLDERRAALADCETLLAENGIDVSREQGKMYVGRFPFYEDCARNVRVRIGGEVRRAIDTELVPLMALYDRLAGAIAAHVSAAYVRIRQDGDVAVRHDLLSFARELQRHRVAEETVAALRPLLREAWRTVIAGKQAVDGEIALDADDLAGLVSAFEQQGLRVSGPQPLGTRVHSPDFLIAAASVDAIRAGQFDLVIGEVHPTVHTVSQPVAQPFCPYQDSVRDEVRDTLGNSRMVAADSDSTYQRSHIDWLDVPELWQVEMPGASARVPGERRIPAARLELVENDGSLFVEDPVSGLVEHLLTVLPGDFHRAAFALAADVLGAGIAERIRLGRTILKRRTWTLQASELPVAERVGESMPAFLAWRRWADAQGLPRHIFVKADTEPKPVFVDFDCPLSLDALTSVSARAQTLGVSEMLPAPHQVWLADERGAFCAEFRTSIVGIAGDEGARAQSPQRHEEALP